MEDILMLAIVGAVAWYFVYGPGATATSTTTAAPASAAPGATATLTTTAPAPVASTPVVSTVPTAVVTPVQVSQPAQIVSPAVPVTPVSNAVSTPVSQPAVVTTPIVAAPVVSVPVVSPTPAPTVQQAVYNIATGGGIPVSWYPQIEANVLAQLLSTNPELSNNIDYVQNQISNGMDDVAAYYEGTMDIDSITNVVLLNVQNTLGLSGLGSLGWRGGRSVWAV